MITIHVAVFVLAAVACGFAIHKLSMMFLRWMLRDGPMAESECPVCERPHDSEVRRYQRWLKKMHENYARVEKERDALLVETGRIRPVQP